MAVGTVAPFAVDRLGAGLTIAASTTPASAALPATGGSSLLVMNAAAAICFVRLDGTASASDLPVPAGQRVLLDCGPYAGAISVLLASGSGSVYVTRGTGSQI